MNVSQFTAEKIEFCICLMFLCLGLGPLKVLEMALKSLYLSLQSDDGKLVLMKAAVAQHVS